MRIRPQESRTNLLIATNIAARIPLGKVSLRLNHFYESIFTMTKKLEQLQMDLDFLMFEIKMMNGFESRFQKETSLSFQPEYIIDLSQQKRISSRSFLIFIDIRERNTNSRPYDYSSGTQFGLQSTETAMKKKLLKVKFVKNISLLSANKRTLNSLTF